MNLHFETATSQLYLQSDETLLKRPNRAIQNPSFVQDINREFEVEPAIYERLGKHPRIISYYGRLNDGFLIRKASHGNLQNFLRANNPSNSLRLHFYRQAIEALAFIHSKGVFHQDIRPDQFLVDETSAGQYDLYLCDFGGSLCSTLNLDGMHMPDFGFFDPAIGDDPQQQDIFGLGSVCYTILTGHWPHRSDAEMDLEVYHNHVDGLFRRKIFPSTTGLIGGDTIHDCWEHKFKLADEMLASFDRERSVRSEITPFPAALKRLWQMASALSNYTNLFVGYLAKFSLVRFFRFGRRAKSEGGGGTDNV